MKTIRGLEVPGREVQGEGFYPLYEQFGTRFYLPENPSSTDEAKCLVQIRAFARFTRTMALIGDAP